MAGPGSSVPAVALFLVYLSVLVLVMVGAFIGIRLTESSASPDHPSEAERRRIRRLTLSRVFVVAVLGLSTGWLIFRATR